MEIIEQLRELKKTTPMPKKIGWPVSSYNSIYSWMVRNGFKTPEYGKSFRCMGILHSLWVKNDKEI